MVVNEMSDSKDSFKLIGDYSISDWREIVKIVNKQAQGVKIDYSQAKIDFNVKILLDEYNSSLNKFKNTKPYSISKELIKIKDIKSEELYLNKFLLKKRRRNILAHVSFLKYLYNFFKGIFIYIKELFMFGKLVLKLRNKHKFQTQIVFQDALNSCYNMGIQAIPIVIFVSFALGIIISLQSVTQLEHFGAQFFAIDIVILSFLKEMGLFIGIIILAARSGSSVVSKIGIMKISDEWDSLKIMGIDPVMFLLVPKILAFVFILPFLGYVACIFGIFGGYIALQGILNLNPKMFFNVLSAVSFDVFISTLWKGPLCGFAIGLICVFETTKIAITSESVINGITRAVVYSIFASILIDTIANIVILYL